MIGRAGWFLLVGAAAIALVLLGRWSVDPSPPEILTQTVTRYVVPEEFAKAVGDLVVERNGLVARLRGVEARAPRVVLVSDTVLSVDTVLLAVNMAGGFVDAAMTYGVLGADSVRGSVIQQGIDIRDCDDGWAYSGGVWTCDRPRLGHLTLGGGIEASLTNGSANESFRPDPLLSAEWTPRFRSTFRVGIEHKLNERSWQVRLTKGVRLW